MTEHDALIAEAELGEEARKFMESDLGKVLLGLARQETGLAQIALETVDPNEKSKIVQLQNQAWLGRKFEEWLLDLVDKGESAMNVFRQQQE